MGMATISSVDHQHMATATTITDFKW